MYQAKFQKLTLTFKAPSGTSRGVLTRKNSWILTLWDPQNPNLTGKGEASIIEGLSPDWDENYEPMLVKVADDINYYINHLVELNQFPSIQLAIETALNDLRNGGNFTIFKTGVRQIPINGLVWMGSEDFMLAQVDAKIQAGFTTIKLKIGAIDFEAECAILAHIRQHYSPEEITIRVDANGAFAPNEALQKLERLAQYGIHSIEQPIKANQWAAMAKLCAQTPLPIALDEELIGIVGLQHKRDLLEAIKPQYIILKPSLVGGFHGTDEWIALAESFNMAWWITSALESNIGLNAIAQYTATKQNLLPQGLGTGSLYTNNIPPYLVVKDGYLWL